MQPENQQHIHAQIDAPATDRFYLERLDLQLERADDSPQSPLDAIWHCVHRNNQTHRLSRLQYMWIT